MMKKLFIFSLILVLLVCRYGHAGASKVDNQYVRALFESVYSGLDVYEKLFAKEKNIDHEQLLAYLNNVSLLLAYTQDSNFIGVGLTSLQTCNLSKSLSQVRERFDSESAQFPDSELGVIEISFKSTFDLLSLLKPDCSQVYEKRKQFTDR